MSCALGSGLDVRGGVEGAKMIVGEKLRRREEDKWACWQGRQRDASGMNHKTNLVLLVEFFLVGFVGLLSASQLSSLCAG